MKEMYICKCGHIHIVELNEEIFEADKEIALVCRNCGTVRVFGAEKTWNEYTEKDAYVLYQYDFAEYKDTVEVSEMSLEYKPLEKFIFSYGIRVPMKNGNYANGFSYGKFFDNSCPADYEIQEEAGKLFNYESDTPFGERFMTAYKAYREDANEVNMNRFIRENKKEDIAFISNFVIKGLDWSDTEFAEKTWNEK